MIRRFFKQLKKRAGPPRRRPKVYVLETAIDFAIANNIAGDYYEFGVYRGQSFSYAHTYFRRQFFKYIAGNAGQPDAAYLEFRPRFFAFDSFAGLPPVPQSSLPLHWRGRGAMACGKDIFVRNIMRAGVDMADVRIVEGFYDASLTASCRESQAMRPGAIFHIDCDLYESTVLVLDFIEPLIQDGAVLVFDDWFYYRGHPQRGERGAFNRWLAKHPRLLATELCAICPSAAYIINTVDSIPFA